MKYNAKALLKGYPLVKNATMRADEFIDTSAIYRDKLVSFSARIESDQTDLIRLIWDYDPVHFGKDVPQPLIFPYAHDNEHVNNHYYIKFVPIAEFQKLKLVNVWDNSALISGIKFREVLYIHWSSIEKYDGFIAKNYPDLYDNPFSALGITCELHMVDNTKVKCYVIASDMYDSKSPRYVRWKKKI